MGQRSNARGGDTPAVNLLTHAASMAHGSHTCIQCALSGDVVLMKAEGSLGGGAVHVQQCRSFIYT